MDYFGVNSTARVLLDFPEPQKNWTSTIILFLFTEAFCDFVGRGKKCFVKIFLKRLV